jgi:outer membrane protein TolC
VLLAAAACLLPAAERPQIPRHLTLKDAVAMAFNHSPVIRRGEARVAGSVAERDLTKSARLPQVSISAFDALQTINLKARGIQAPAIPGVGFLLPTRVGPFSQVDARALVTQELWNMPLRYRHQAGNARIEASASENLNTREVLALQVALAYAEAQAQQLSVDTQRRQLELAKELQGITSDREQGGIASALDVRRSRQQTNYLRQALLETETALTAAKLQLANLIHAQVSSSYELDAMASPDGTGTPGESEAITTALQTRPDYRAAQSQMRAIELDLRAARSRRYPTLSFSGDYGQSGRAPFQNLNTYRIQGSLNVPIYLGGAISAEARQQQSRLDEAQAMLDEVQAQIETDVLTALAGVKSAEAQVKVAAETIGLAGEELELSRERFTGGVADNMEVVNAQDRLERAEQNRIRALFQWHVTRANLERAMGSAEKTYRP